MNICSYCLNTGRLPIPEGVVSANSNHLYYDCPVCQENRVNNENEEPELVEEDYDFEEQEQLLDHVDEYDLFEKDWEEEEDVDEDFV